MGEKHLISLSCRPFVWLGLWLVCAGLSAAAGPEVPTPTPAVIPFHITDQGGEIGFQYDSVRGRDQSIGNNSSYQNRTFEEYILYRMRANVYRPDVLDIDASVKLGLLQQAIRNHGLEGDENFGRGELDKILDSYNIYLSFFKAYPLSFAVHARRDREPVMELFTDRFLTDTRDNGASVKWDNALFPMELSVGETRTKEWGFESRTDSTSKYLDYTIRNAVGTWMNTELNYRYNNYHQIFRTEAFPGILHQDFHLRSNELNLHNTIFLDPSHRNYLESTLRYLHQDGTDSMRDLNWQERLALRHSDNFSTYYLFNYLHDHLTGETVDTYRAEVGADHKLFDSLVKHLDLHWRKSDFAGASERQYGVTGRLDYRKRNPVGTLSLDYRATLDGIEHRGDSGVLLVHQEALTMRAAGNNFLAHPDVIVSSIKVTSQDRLTSFIEFFDYNVIVQGNRIALRPTVFGRITDGQTVLVTYNVGFTGHLNYSSANQDFNANFDFERYLTGLSLYYRWHQLSTDDAPTNDLSILRFTENAAGFAYTWRWLTWREEYDRYRSTFGSYDQILSQVEGLHAIGSRLRLGWHAGVQRLNYRDGKQPLGPDESNAVFADAVLRGTLRTNGYWELKAEGRRETGQIRETLWGVLGKVGLHWRKARLEAGVRAEEQSRPRTERDRYGVFLQISREF